MTGKQNGQLVSSSAVTLCAWHLRFHKLLLLPTMWLCFVPVFAPSEYHIGSGALRIEGFAEHVQLRKLVVVRSSGGRASVEKLAFV